MNYKKYFISSLVIIGLLILVYFAAGLLMDNAITIRNPTANQVVFSGTSLFLNATFATGNTTNHTSWFIDGTFLYNKNDSSNMNASHIQLPIAISEGLHNITLNSTNFTTSGIVNVSEGGWNVTTGPYEINVTQTVYVVKNLGEGNISNTTGNDDNAGITFSDSLLHANVTGTSFNFNATIGPKNMTSNATWLLTNLTDMRNITLFGGSLNGTNLVNLSGFDTAALPDGTYTLRLNVTNDSVSHENCILLSTNITIDNTAPLMTMTLSDSDGIVYTRGEQKVTCTATDATTGISGTLNEEVTLKFTKPTGDEITKKISKTNGDYTFKNADTAKTGEYTVKCSAKDYVGIEVIETQTFDVRVRSSGPPSGAPGAPSYDYSLVERDTTVASGREGSSKTFSLDGMLVHTIDFVTVTETSVTLRVSSTPQEFTLNIGGSQDVDLNDDGATDVKVTLTNIANGRASLTLDKLAGAAMITEPSTEEVEERRAEEERRAAEEAERRAKEGGAGTTTLIVIIVIIIVIVGGYFLLKKGGKGKGKKGHIKFSRAELRQR